MTKYKIRLGVSRREIEFSSDELNMDEVLLLVADTYGDEYYGCSVSDDRGNWISVAVKDYFVAIGHGTSAKDDALRRYIGALKLNHGYYNTKYDWDEQCDVRMPIKNIFDESED